MQNTTILVTAAPTWADAASIAAALRALAPTVVLVGDAPGTERLVAVAASSLGCTVTVYPVLPQDGAWPGAADPRDARMVLDGRPTRGIAFGPIWKRRRSGGRRCRGGYDLTRVGHMVRRLLAMRRPVRWLPSPEATPVDLVRMPPSPDRLDVVCTIQPG